MKRIRCDCTAATVCPQGRGTLGRCEIWVGDPFPRRVIYRRSDGTDCLVTIASPGEPPVIQELGPACPVLPAPPGPAWTDIAGALEAVLDSVPPGLRAMLQQAIRELRAG